MQTKEEIKKYKSEWYEKNRNRIRTKENTRFFKNFRNFRIYFSKELKKLKEILNDNPKLTTETLMQLKKVSKLHEQYEIYSLIVKKTFKKLELTEINELFSVK